jgi:AcrR family transcriptional regulator
MSTASTFSPTDRRRGNTRQRILDTASALFAERGYVTTSVADIEAAVGLTPGSGGLYRHFVSKEALLLAVVNGYKERLSLVRATLTLGATETPERELQQIVTSLAVFLSGEGAVIRVGAEFSQLPDAPRKVIGAAWDEAHGIFSDLFERHGFSAHEAMALGVAALGSLAHFFEYLRNFGKQPLNIEMDCYLEIWYKTWAPKLVGT